MTWLRRVLALAVLMAFLAQALGAPNFVVPPRAWAQAAPGAGQPAALVAQSAAEIDRLLGAIQEKSGQGFDVSMDLQRLQSAVPALQSALGGVRAQLDSAAQTLESLVQQGQVSADVVANLAAFRTNFDTASGDLLNSLAALQTPPVTQGQLDTARAALNALKAPPAPTMTELTPNTLPHRRADIPRRGLEARTAITPGQTPPAPADLEPTLDAQITPRIQAAAAEQQFDPAKLFALVRNTIDFQPYFGSLKGSDATLADGGGNDMDQASLLVALLRASGIPARYVAGSVEVPIVKAMNWVGVDTPPAAVEVFARNGFPFQTITSADGTITHLVFFHLWAEAFIPQGPGKGTNASSAWVQLDPSFKQYDAVPGVDLQQAIGFDINGFAATVKDGAVINDADSSFTHLNDAGIQAAIDGFAANYTAFVQANFPETALARDVVGFRGIRPIDREQLNRLAQSFPFRTFSPQLELSELFDSFRHVANFAMFGFSRAFALPELAGKRVSVGYVAATPGDQAIIDAFGGILNVFPAFIVRLKPQLRVEGEVLAEGGAVTLGSSQVLRSAFRRPLALGFDVNDRIVTTGAHYVIALDLQRARLAAFRPRADAWVARVTPQGTSTPLTDDLIDETLQVTGLSYFSQTDALGALIATLSGVVYTREPSEAIVSQDLLVFFVFGFPLFLEQGAVGIDVKRNIFSPVSATGDPAHEVQFMLASGSFGSAAEHAIFEQTYQIPAVSTERLLKLASRASIPIFTIDASNIARILPRLDTFDVVRQNIIDSINAGMIAIVPQRNQQFHDWLGMGWIVMDPATGSAGYLLAGSLVSGEVTATAGGSGAVPSTTRDAMAGAAKAFGIAQTIILMGEGLGVAAEGGIIIAEATTAALVIGGVAVFAVGIAMAAAAGFLYYKLGGPIPFVSLRRRTLLAGGRLTWLTA